MPKFAQLERVEITDELTNEPQHFTPWLAKDGLEILAETLGLKLEFVDMEVRVGQVSRFRADIQARNTFDETDVVIENQFGKSDHRHLGQILTYAGGIAPKTVIWIAENFTEEHIDALDYLNKITKKRFRFFGVTITLYRIGNSEPAPQFQVVCKPRHWTQENQRLENETKQLQLEYWTALQDYAREKDSSIRLRKPYGKNFIMYEQRDKVEIGAYHNINRKEIGVSLYISGERLDLLKERRGEIEKKIGKSLYWDKPRQIYLDKSDSDPRDKKQWEDQHQWLSEKLELFDSVFRPILHLLNSTETAAETEPDELES